VSECDDERSFWVAWVKLAIPVLEFKSADTGKSTYPCHPDLASDGFGGNTQGLYVRG